MGPGLSFGVPFVGSRAQGLGGVLPALPWERYTACGLEGNHWACPLPDGAHEHCMGGEPLTCYND